MINPIYFVVEEWKALNCEDIKPNTYEISNCGRVRNINTGRLLSMPINKDGYVTVFLQTYDNQRKSYFVHRLVAMTFIPNPENKPIVHHSSYIPDFNYYEVLEWVTHEKHNTYHNNGKTNIIINKPINNNWGRGDMTYGENNGMSEWTEEIVHNICKHIELGYSYGEALELSGVENTENNRYNVSHIVQGVRWKYISNQYNISSRKNNNYEDHVETVCKMLEEGKTTSEIIDVLGLNISRDNVRHFIRRVRNRIHYTHISDKYNW